MRKAIVFYKGEEAGKLIQNDTGAFSFIYNNSWLENPEKPAISLTLPKTKAEFYSKHLFAFFFNMLPEGTNKKMICKLMRLDEDDYFSLLLLTARNDSIGAITVSKEL